MEENGIFTIFEEFEKHLRDIVQSGPTAIFWLSFLDMMDILFAFLRSTKVGNWNLHLEATNAMLPWMFAYDHQNYSRFITYYWSQMTRLPTAHPNIFNEFLLGNFAVRRTPGKFNKVPSDQCIEQTINREQKGHGGIKGYSTSVGTIQRWEAILHRSVCLTLNTCSHLRRSINYQRALVLHGLNMTTNKFEMLI